MLHASPVAPVFNIPQHVCLHELLEDQARRIPEALAIVAPERTPLTYRRLRAHVDDVGQRLHAMGLGRHDRIALVLPNGPEMAVASLAVAAHATCAPLNAAYSASELDAYLAGVRAHALIIQAGLASPARAVAQARGLGVIELSPVLAAEAGIFTLMGEEQPRTEPPAFALPNDVAFVLHTAGTTSRPKIVPLTHTNICTAAHNLRLAFQLVESDRCLNVLPLFHVHALQTALLTSLVAGASIVCTPGFYAPQFFAWLAEFRPTWYTAVPTIHQAILARAPLHRAIIARCPLRFIRSASAALPLQVLTELEEVFHTQVVETYGATEVSGHITCQPLPSRPRKTGAVGMAAGPEVTIMDAWGTLLPAGETGEVVVRGASLMQGYDNDPMANQSAFTSGWFRTGDQGYVDADGYLFITGRLKEIINRGGEKIAPNRGGEKIAPLEVDQVLMEHPAVAEAVTFAVPHAQLGEDIAAAVVLRQNAAATASDIRQFVATRLTAFKVPSQVCIVEAIPQSPTGKLQRSDLAEKLGLTVSDRARPERQASFITPCTPLEEVLAGLWVQVLEVEGVGIHDNFFELGGDSMLATQLMSRVREATHVEVSFVSFFETPTVAGKKLRRWRWTRCSWSILRWPKQ